ncbi:MarR family transcriptional regulator [Azoarcus sp. TTM-91]|uniref:MarR family winged helix-turn-helix transcriptional regulator n=1 Tax=Azoarcus sp. TTM-91 TaxID=2691581 RepID=UPI001B7D1804|nr:MarR family transcriptional regulator [Azoarcus sp. TTM-91]
METSLPGQMPDQVDKVLAQWAAAAPAVNVAPMAVMSRLFRLVKRVEKEMARRFRDHGLQEGEFDLLATLYRAGPPCALTPQQLVHAILLSSAAMTHRLDRLEAAGFVRREANPEDRRSVVVVLTGAGQAALLRALGDYLDVMESFLAPLDAADRARLAGLLKAMLLYPDGDGGVL